jgi:ADP-heptose:LPS heptosyltransferase
MEILFITYNRLGDAVLSTGILNEVIAQNQGAHVTVACGPVPAAIFQPLPALKEIIVLEKGPRLAHWRKLWSNTIGTKWDLVIDLRGSAISWLLRSHRRIVAGKAPADRHRVEALGDLLALTPPPSPGLWTSAEDDESAQQLLPSDSNGADILALGPTANWGGKQWPAERFAELAISLTGGNGILPDAPIAVFGAPHENETTDRLLQALPPGRAIDANRGQSLPVTYAMLKRCTFYVGNDSGLMHMAAAAGTATLGLFGPSREENYGPWGSRAGSVRTGRSFEAIVNHPDYDYNLDDCWMQDLPVAKVDQAAHDLFLRAAEQTN